MCGGGGGGSGSGTTSPTTTTSNVNTQTVLPQWYQDYLQQIMGQAIGQAQANPPTFNVAPVAGLSPQQQAAIQGAQQSVGMGQQQINQGFDLTNAAAGVNSGAAADQQYGQASGIYGNVANNSNIGGVSQPYVDQGTGYLQQAAGANGAPLAAANPYIQQSVAPTGLAAASPYLSAASGSFPQAAQSYMNPYTQNVIQSIQQLGQQNLQENILPSISDQFINAGQFGSPQMGTVTSRAIRDLNNSELQAQSQALQAGYTQAANTYESDASRQAQLAGTAGGLGTAQQQTQLAAGTELGNLTSAQLAQLASAGVNIGNLGLGQAAATGQGQQLQLGAAQGLQGIGQSNINASQADAARQLAAGAQLGNLASNAQNLNYQQLGALDSAGQEVQANNQQNLSSLAQNELYQQNYPWTQIQNASGVIQGLPNLAGSSTQSQVTPPSPSTTSQIAGLGVGIAGLAQSGIFKAKGGAVRGVAKKYKRTHSYGNVPRRGIDLSEAA